MKVDSKLDAREKVLGYILEQFPGLKSQKLQYGDPLVGVLDSLAILGVIGFIEPEFGVQLDPSDVTDENFSSVAAISELVSRLSQQAA